MTIQVVAPTTSGNLYPRRGDRLLEEPSAKNAQGLFPPDACIFVGNLSTKVTGDKLAEDLKALFSKFGPCHVKIKQDKKKGLPGAFVQFEKVEDASAVLSSDECSMLHDRWLRIERAKGRRTACLGLRSGAPIEHDDVVAALGSSGPLEVFCIQPLNTGVYSWSAICKVTFAYVDDCRDAIKHFQKNEKYFLTLLDIDGSPMLPPDMVHPSQPPKPKPQNHPARNNQPRPHDNRPYRNGHFNNNRGGMHSAPPFHPPPFHSGNFPPSAGVAGYPAPPVMFNGMPGYNNAPPPFYPEPFYPEPFDPNMWYGSSFNPAPPPEAYYPAPMAPPVMNNTPFIVSSQPGFAPGYPAYYGEPYPPPPPQGYFPPPPHMMPQPGYFDPVHYPENYPSSTGYISPQTVSDSRHEEMQSPPKADGNGAEEVPASVSVNPSAKEFKPATKETEQQANDAKPEEEPQPEEPDEPLEKPLKEPAEETIEECLEKLASTSTSRSCSLVRSCSSRSI